MSQHSRFSPRVTFVGLNLGGGGAERVMCLMANYWAERGRDVTIIKLDSEADRPIYALDARVVLVSADVGVSLLRARQAPMVALLTCLSRLRRLIAASRPDLVIGFLTLPNAFARLATLGSRIPVVLMEHNDPRVYPVLRRTAFLRRLTYPLATRVIVLHSDHGMFFSNWVRRKVVVMPIPIAFGADELRAAREAADPKTGTRAVAMGRLNEQKGFDILIRGFARVAAAHPTWSLDIWGEGECRGELERLVEALGLTGRVRLPGRTARPLETMCRYDMFVLASRHEGMPAVLAEAMAAGLAVIAFDCPTGPATMIRHEVDGLLVPPEDEEGLASAMERLMGDASERARLAGRAVEIQDRFDLPSVMDTWDVLLSDIVR